LYNLIILLNIYFIFTAFYLGIRTKNLYHHIEEENQKIIDDSIEERKTENNISSNFQKSATRTLKYLSKHSGKNFNEITRGDLVSFLTL